MRAPPSGLLTLFKFGFMFINFYISPFWSKSFSENITDWVRFSVPEVFVLLCQEGLFLRVAAFRQKIHIWKPIKVPLQQQGVVGGRTLRQFLFKTLMLSRSQTLVIILTVISSSKVDRQISNKFGTDTLGKLFYQLSPTKFQDRPIVVLLSHWSVLKWDPPPSNHLSVNNR